MKTVLLLLLPLLLTACGQAGPLYLPDQGPKHAHSKAGASTPAPAATPATQQDREQNKTPAASPTP